MIPRERIDIRDPFVFPYENGYLMTGTIQVPDQKPAIWAYASKDLEHFEGPIRLFEPPSDFWADRDFWAPEIHKWKEKYYLFASFRSLLHRRATQVFVADEPAGPYHILGDEPYTPEEWHCLDGTLYVDKHKQPWMVYVREFVQMVDGEMYAQRLSSDFTHLEGKPQKLFCATWAPWCVTNDEGGMPFDIPGGYITDGPYLFKLTSGKLGMLWSSFCKKGYCQAVCYSSSGDISGPWAQEDQPLYMHDSGHGMLFTTHDGRRMMVLHDHNHSLEPSNPVFLQVAEKDGKLYIPDENQEYPLSSEKGKVF